MSLSDNYPDIRALWMNDYANAGVIDPRCSFTRSDSTPSNVHYWSDEDHLSSENLLLDSKTGTANWTADIGGSAVVPTVTANHAASPDGTASQATRVQLNLNGQTSGSDYSRYQQAHNVASGTSATFCIWAKSTDGASSYAAQLLAPDGSGTAITITGSWQKFSATATSVGNLAYGIRLRGGQTPTNADTADILVWGANLSTTGQTVLSETTTQIHREYAATLKSVASSGQPRFEYDPVTREADGLLLESSSTTKTTYSEQMFTDYVKNRSTITTNSAIAPSGELTANLWTVDGTASNSHNLGFDFATGGTADHTYSVFAKAGNVNYLIMRWSPANGAFNDGYVSFNLANGTIGTTTGTVSSSSIQDCSNGWYRCSITTTALASATGRVVLYIAQADNTLSFDGNSYDHLLVWGAQIEEGNFPSSYIKSNSGSTSTRTAESLTVATADIGYTGGDTSVVGEFSFLEDEASPVGSWTAAPRLLAITDGEEELMVYRNVIDGANTLVANVEVSSTDYNALATTVNTGAGVNYKVGMSVQSGSIKGCMDGGVVTTNTSAILPGFSSPTLFVGSLTTTQGHMNGHCKKLAIYSEALTDTELQSLTS